MKPNGTESDRENGGNGFWERIERIEPEETEWWQPVGGLPAFEVMARLMDLTRCRCVLGEADGLVSEKGRG